MRQPSVSDPVIVVGRPAESNGADAAAGVVTRVWHEREDGSWLVNLTVFPDNNAPVSATSIPLYPTADAARAQLPSTAAYLPQPF